MHEKIENLLAELDVATKQVEIEARFVEVNEDALEEFGFQWQLTDNYEIASNNQYANPVMNQRIQINKDSQGFTKGLRFFNYDGTTATRASSVTAGLGETPMGNILTFASILTNPELQVAINALAQKGHADVLSSPRVTTKNSEQATIKVVTEIRYPQAYEANQIQIPSAGLSSLNVTVFTPADFQTREVGVLLNVTPTIGPDGYTIDLTLVPEVSELIEWHDYGQQTGGDVSFNAPQPFFQTRTVTSKMVVWDGETVVLGGLIKEELTDFADKIPVLGDIPLLGKLFQSKGSNSQKKNLMIFVTARIVDSSGRPIHRKVKPTLTSQGTTKSQTEVAPATNP
jgi:general secretion pathway protein D